MWRADSLEKILMLGKIEGKRKGVTEDEMVGWHHWLNGQEFGDGEGQVSLAFCSPRGRKDSDRTQRLNNNNTSYIILIRRKKKSSSAYSGKVDTTPTANVADDVKKSLQYIKTNPPQVYTGIHPEPSSLLPPCLLISWLQFHGCNHHLQWFWSLELT